MVSAEQFEKCSGAKAVRLVQSVLQNAGIDADEVAFEAYQLVKLALEGEDPRLCEMLLPKQAKYLYELCQKRCKRVPLQYLVGSWGFLDFELKVGEGVLIPREDTELLCLAAADCARAMGAKADDGFAALLGGWRNPPPQKAIQDEKCVVLDLCAGSGCVGLGIQRMLPDASITAVEKSPQAFGYLLHNTKDTKICPIQADVFGFETTLAPKSVWVIASNPPYITEQEMQQLAPELYHEPQMALYAPNEGLAFYEYFAKRYRSVLKSGGWMVFEIGAKQGQAVKAILTEQGAEFVEILQDSAGRDRVVRARFE